jgi:glycosyltransferase involved in cell wall biosynthesis
MGARVSIVIPTYNTAGYISETLNSIFIQSYEDYEIIVVDDGSTDNTREVLEPYMENTRYIYQENRGRAGARNTGIKAAKGKYIAFLDSDDLWATADKLGTQVDMMESNQNIDFLFGDKQRFSDNGTIVIASMFKERHYDENFFGDPLYVRDAYKKLLQEPYIPTGTIIMKKECFDRAGFFDETIYAEDWEFWLRIALFNQLAYSSEIWELERDREGSGSKNLKAVYLSNVQALEKHEREFNDELFKLNIDIDSTICDKYVNVGYFLLGRESPAARKCFQRSLLRNFRAKILIYWLCTFLGTFPIRIVRGMRQ